MAASIRFLFVGGKEPWCIEAAEFFLPKISAHNRADLVRMRGPALDRSAADAKRRLESEKIMESLKPEDRLVALDPRGSRLSSEEFSSRVSGLLTGSARVVFLVGGAFGLEETVRKRAQLCVRISDMILSHEIAQVVLLEQVYRALSIAKGVPYHVPIRTS